MLTEERHQFIQNQLNKDSTVQVKKLVESLGVSESTIRRDLSQLEEEGLLVRIHGGAKRSYRLDTEATLKEKATTSKSEKQAIGKFAASLVQDGDTIFLDAGTTTATLIPHLVGKSNLKIVTNGLKQAEYLSELAFQVIVLGGQLKVRTQAIIGTTATNQLATYRFNKAFIGINGVDIAYGLTTPDDEERNIKRLALDLASDAYFLADVSKFNKVSFSQVAPLENQRIITNKLPTTLQADFQSIANIKEVIK